MPTRIASSPKFLFRIVVASSLSLIAISAFATHFAITITASLPRGLWRLDKDRVGLHRGDIAIFCLPRNAVTGLALSRGYVDQGKCPSGIEPQMKPIAAVAGDFVDFTASGVRVNGTLLPNSTPLVSDDRGRPAPPANLSHAIVPLGRVWLISGYTPRSFDSRYYGSIAVDSIRHLVRPWLVAASGRP